MPSATARRLYEDQIPSLMSVFDLDSELIDRQSEGALTVVNPKLMAMESTCAPLLSAETQHLRQSSLSSDPSHKHNDSTSTQNSESAESSPTTTMSCTDSSSLSDPSPSSSPDSPINMLPLAAFPAHTMGTLPLLTNPAIGDSNFERPLTSPTPRRPKNMKGLSIQPPFAGSPVTSLVSEPASPVFIKPMIPVMKRKPSLLSLKTNSSDLINRTTLEVPNSPGLAPILQRRALKHSTSSPHMLSSLKSATFGPAGGMTIPTVLERNESGLSEFLRPTRTLGPEYTHTPIKEEESPIKAQVANRAAFDFEPYHEQENNEDQKSPGYPDGPIAIYGSDVYLYLEPTAEEASKFDVVINVAREVKNPFKEVTSAPESAPSADAPATATSVSSPETAGTATNYSMPFEFHPDEAAVETPTTPKANLPLLQPEYIHMPWDHNTDIGSDLMTLCETIERKTSEGKKVLVHCQQGASRSASLIIAYGMYQNPDLSVNDAYYAAQARSKWISPNMRLMYCLQDFQKEVSKRKAVPNSGFRPRTGRSPTKHRTTLSADAIDISPKEPLTAPLPGEDIVTRSASPERSPLRSKGALTPNGGDPISPGPSSAPSSFSWSEKEDDKDRGKPGRFNIDSIVKPPRIDLDPPSTESSPKPPPSPGFSGFNFGFSSVEAFPKPPPSPGFSFTKSDLSLRNFSRPGQDVHAPKPKGFRKIASALHLRSDTSLGQPGGTGSIAIAKSYPDDSALMSPRAETMTNNPLHQTFSGLAGLRFVESPPTPSEGLFSPRETMFPRDPFFPFGRPTQVTDPRSPPTKGETPIVRSIDDLL